jgi:hypothetical protein
MVGYLYPDEDWMTAPWEDREPDTNDAPEPWDADDDPDYEREYAARKAEARSELDSVWIDTDK